MTWPTVRTKYVFNRKDVRGVKAPLASATKDGVFLRSDLSNQVWNPGEDVSNFKLVEPGDFVIGLRSFQHGISFSGVKGLVSPAYTVLSAERSVVLDFYKHYFRSPVLISMLDNVSQGIRQGRTIDYEAFSNLDLPVPPVEEQRRIANFLDAEVSLIDQAYSRFSKIREALAERSLAVVNEALKGVHGAPLVPISTVCSRIVDCVNKTAPVSDEETPFRMIRTSNIRDGRVDLSNTLCVEESVFYNWNRRGAPRRGDILLTREAPLGQVGLLESEDLVFLGQRLVLYRPDLQKIDAKFLLFGMLSSGVDEQIARLGAGSLHPHMRVTDALKIRIPLPSLEVQKEVVKQIQDARDSNYVLDEKIQRQISLLEERKRALITAAVTGQIDVTTARGADVT